MCKMLHKPDKKVYNEHLETECTNRILIGKSRHDLLEILTNSELNYKAEIPPMFEFIDYCVSRALLL